MILTCRRRTTVTTACTVIGIYEGIYERGEERLRVFLEPGPFVPFAARWQALRPLIA